MASDSQILALRAATTVSLLGAPLYWLQGRRVRRKTPRLDEAPGKRSGRVPGAEPVFRIVGLGESPMAAVGLSDQAEGVVPILAGQLAAASPRRIEWQTAARSGATARFTADELLPQVDVAPTDLVIIALGVNDCLALTSPARWRARLAHLTQAVTERLEPKRILLAGIPPMQHFPALPAPLSMMLGLRASLLDAVSEQFAERRPGVLHAAMNFVDQPDSLFCRDGFHPNARAHALWAEQLAALAFK
ncbi:MAG: SGNH/GDSL hydrolase family protein [Xanthomonadales bacterium]|nr:SGNH/GDSL hydrolase family protein [Xanthomonadales bacterium]